jgi:radical SAM superfamily enzyme YgiQ (UPF0313 family)
MAVVRQKKPQVVGISSLFSSYSDTAADIASHIKQFDPSITTVMGGAHAWAMPEQVLATGAVDFIIRGEAEWSFLSLCRQLRNPPLEPAQIATIPGIGFRKEKSCYLHPDYGIIKELGSLPLPARNLLDHSKYTINGRRYTMLLTSRGCPHSCGFCALSATPCAAFRLRPAKDVLEEIYHCYQHHNIHHFDIEDDNFTADHDHASKIMHGITTMDGIRLSAMNGISACNLSPSLLQDMAQTGFTHLDLALVTSDLDKRKAISRPGSLKQFDAILHETASCSLKTTVHVILGLPDDTIENMLDTLLYLMARPCQIGANIYYPVPGSTLFTGHQEHISYQEPRYWRSTLASCEAYEGQRDQYMTLFYLARIINFIKHLLARHGTEKNNWIFRDAVDTLLQQHVLPEAALFIGEQEIACDKRLPPDMLGIIMLHRFRTKKQVDHVSLIRDGNRVKYLFKREFCRQDIIEKFLEMAEKTPLVASC